MALARSRSLPLTSLPPPRMNFRSEWAPQTTCTDRTACAHALRTESGGWCCRCIVLTFTRAKQSECVITGQVPKSYTLGVEENCCTQGNVKHKIQRTKYNAVQRYDMIPGIHHNCGGAQCTPQPREIVVMSCLAVLWSWSVETYRAPPGPPKWLGGAITLQW